MKRIMTVMVLVATMVLATASLAQADVPANAGEPTCAGVDLGNGPLGNHGDHIKDDYVHPGEPGGANGGPAHFNHPPEIGPGASFCLEQAEAQSPSLPPGQG